MGGQGALTAKLLVTSHHTTFSCSLISNADGSFEPCRCLLLACCPMSIAACLGPARRSARADLQTRPYHSRSLMSAPGQMKMDSIDESKAPGFRTTF